MRDEPRQNGPRSRPVTQSSLVKMPLDRVKLGRRKILSDRPARYRPIGSSPHHFPLEQSLRGLCNLRSMHIWVTEEVEREHNNLLELVSAPEQENNGLNGVS